MAMLNTKIEIAAERRDAEVTVSEFWSNKLGVEAGKHACYVLGLYQYADDDGAGPVFVVELYGGKVFDTSVENVTFVERSLLND